MRRQYLPVDQLQQQYLLGQLNCKVVVQFHGVSIQVEEVKQNPNFSFRHFSAWLTSSKIIILVSFEILRSWAIQNSPWKLNLGNWKLRKLSSKESSFSYPTQSWIDYPWLSLTLQLEKKNALDWDYVFFNLIFTKVTYWN